MNHTALTVTFFSFLRPDGKIQLMSGNPSDIEDGKSTEVVDLEAKTSVSGFDLIEDYSVSFNSKSKPVRDALKKPVAC